jgi:hypothetical protein
MIHRDESLGGIHGLSNLHIDLIASDLIAIVDLIRPLLLKIYSRRMGMKYPLCILVWSL